MSQEKSTNPTQPDLFPSSFQSSSPIEMMVNTWQVAEAIAIVDARQRESDERRHPRPDAATLSLFDDV